MWGAPEARYADAFVDMARQDVLDNPGPDPTVVVVHADADVVDGTAEGNGSIDGIPVAADTVRRLLCDCEIDYSVDGPDGTCVGIGRAGRTPPRWLRRRLLRRDGGVCRFPGCDRPIRHLHHIQHWIRGGPTDSYNLAGFCWNHHHLVHEGGWIIEGNPDIELTFTSPYGRTLTSGPPAPTHRYDPAPWHTARHHSGGRGASEVRCGATCGSQPRPTEPPRHGSVAGVASG